MPLSRRLFVSKLLGSLRGCPPDCYFALGDHVVYRRSVGALDRDARGTVTGFPDYGAGPDAPYGEALLTAALREVLGSSPRLVVDWGWTDMLAVIRNEPTLMNVNPHELRHHGPCPRGRSNL